MSYELEIIQRITELESDLNKLLTLEKSTSSGSPATQIVETSGPTTLDIGSISDGEYLKRSGSNIFSGKPWQPRVYSTTSSTTPTPNVDSYDMFILTALAGNATFGSPSGSPTQGQKLLIRIKDNGTARTLSWNSIYRSVGVVLPTGTTAGKTLYVGFVYNSTDSKWDCVAKSEEA